MGSHQNIGFDKFPQQSDWLSDKRVIVCFDYDTENTLPGVVVRCDAQAPGTMIIRLADGRYVLSTECMYRLAPQEEDDA